MITEQTVQAYRAERDLAIIRRRMAAERRKRIDDAVRAIYIENRSAADRRD